MKLSIQDRKNLVDKFPYLDTGVSDNDSDNFYLVGELELPEGWFRLFLLYCKNILDTVDKDFHFLQVKEKWGCMRIYHTYNEAVQDRTYRYEEYSKCVCYRKGVVKFPPLENSECWKIHCEYILTERMSDEEFLMFLMEA